MSALNVFMTPDEAFLFSDTCVYDAGGSVRSWAGKVYALPTYRAAFGGRGSHVLKLAVLATIESNAPAGDTFDALCDRLETILEEALFQVAPHIQGRWSIVGEYFFVGWSDREKRMKGYVIHSKDGDDGLFYNKQEIGLGGFITCPNMEGTVFDIDLSRFGAVESSEIPSIGVLIMDRQRQHVQRDFPNAHVDGEVMLTHVTKGGVSMRSLHRWEAGAPPLLPV